MGAVGTAVPVRQRRGDELQRVVEGMRPALGCGSGHAQLPDLVSRVAAGSIRAERCQPGSHLGVLAVRRRRRPQARHEEVNPRDEPGTGPRAAAPVSPMCPGELARSKTPLDGVSTDTADRSGLDHGELPPRATTWGLCHATDGGDTIDPDTPLRTAHRRRAPTVVSGSPCAPWSRRSGHPCPRQACGPTPSAPRHSHAGAPGRPCLTRQ